MDDDVINDGSFWGTHDKNTSSFTRVGDIVQTKSTKAQQAIHQAALDGQRDAQALKDKIFGEDDSSTGDGPGDPPKKGANSLFKNCPKCLIPSSIGHNIIGLYGGGDNPMSYDFTENYSLKPLNHSDFNAMNHDHFYDANGGQGPLSVFFNYNLIPGDYALISSSFNVVLYPLASPKDKLQSVAMGAFFSIATAPKSVPYWSLKGWGGAVNMGSSIVNRFTNIVNEFVQGVSSYNNGFQGW